MPDPGLIAQVFAPAKINLTLHVTGQRADGYHLLDTLVVFADVGDALTLRRDNGFSIHVDGPEAKDVPVGADNLVLRVARLFEGGAGVTVNLDKQLPVSSGIGGGSADAAAAYRGVRVLFEPEAAGEPQSDALLALGADIPMCVAATSARIGGIGETIVPIRTLPALHAVLANPRCAVSTPSVFKALHHRHSAPMPDVLPAFETGADLAIWLADQRNDLDAAAISIAPVIAQVKAALAQAPQCILARMSGSGATCFGLFPDREAARSAAAHLAQTHPDWWIRSAELGDQSARAAPQLIRSTT